MKKIKIKKLSVKILLILFSILMALVLLVGIIELIFRIAGIGVDLLKDRENIENWFFVFMIIIMLIMGISIVFTFAYAVNKTIVARIRKLNDATKEVIKGNLDVNIDVKGYDELSSLTESFNKMSAELKANEYLSKEFVRNVSHEFKTPLTAVRAYGELVEIESDKEIADKTALKEYAKIIVDETDRLTALSKSILQLSLLDSTVMIKKEDSFCPAEQIRNILRLMHHKWREKKIEFDLRLDETPIKNNEQLLYEVWQNLIGNAVKFSNPDGKVKIVLGKNDKGLYFEITDQGIGIKDEDKQNIFTQFFVSDKSRNTEGSGLGLPIAKKIVEKLGGEIGFESKENEGTQFFVQLLD